MSSRTAAARKRLQDPHPKVSAFERLVNQAKSVPSATGADLSSSNPHLRDTNLMHHSTVYEPSAYPRPLDISQEFPQSFPSPEYSRTYFPHQSSDKKSKRIGSSQVQAISKYGPPSVYNQTRSPLQLDPPHVVTYQTPPPPPNPRLPKIASPAKVLMSYVPDLPLPPSYPPPSPTRYSGESSHPAAFYLSSSSSPPSLHRSPRQSVTSDLPEYRSVYSFHPDSHMGRSSLQVATMNLDRFRGDHQHTDYQHPSSPLFVSPSTTSLPIRNADRLPNRVFPGAQSALNFSSPTSPVHASHEYPGDSASTISGLSSFSGISTSTGWQPPPPPPSPIFVFPGSRSIARPKVSSKIVTSELKRRSKSKSRQGRSPLENLHALAIPSQDSLVAFETAPKSPVNVRTPVQSNYLDPLPEENTVVLNSDDYKRKFASSVPKTPTDTFIFPTARSRAQPKSSSRRKPTKSSNYPSTSRDVNQPGGRSRFMETLFKKKKKVGKPNITPVPNFASSSMASSTDHLALTEEQLLSESITGQREPRMMRSKKGNYPLDPYNSVLLDNDRHTGELLSRLNPTGLPSFSHGKAPPSSVLDLGCGQGHWVLEAAIVWKEYGTHVTGYDMVDISRNLLPCAAEQGVLDNIRFVRGNFLKQPLPFSSNTFDLVRMSCLALCITSDSWGFILQEVHRVLMTGGRLEFIDDQIFFPYGQLSSLMNDTSSTVESFAPRVDAVISPTVTTFSIYGDIVANPGLASTLEQRGSDDVYRVKDESDLDKRATTLSHKSRTTAQTPTAQSRPKASPPLSPAAWNRALVISEDLETLFEHMLLEDFDIHIDPSEFILSLMKKVFGRAREVKTMHLVLAPPDPTAQSQSSPQGLSNCPGLILWPSTFIPMDYAEIEIHASKHLRTLLSCKNFLAQHAIEIADDERVDEEFVSEALWEYESFLRHRFNPPPLPPVPSSDHPDEGSETSSIRSSVTESTTSDSVEAVLEIQSEFRERFAWLPERDPLNTLVSQDETPAITPSPPTSPMSARSTGDRYPTTPPSCNEITHVRTFRVYEAIKLDNYVLTYDTH